MGLLPFIKNFRRIVTCKRTYTIKECNPLCQLAWQVQLMLCEQTLMKLSAGLQEIRTMFKIGTKGKEIGVCRNFFNMEVKCCFGKNQHCVQDNDIGFWREFVSEYFAPHAKKRWCVSLYGSSGRQPTGVFPQVFFY